MTQHIVTSFLQGGLGNIMFQLAAAIGYANRYNYDYRFYLSRYQQSHHGPIEQYLSNILSNLKLEHNPNSQFLVYNEPDFHYNLIPNINHNIMLYGYFQSYKYFEHCASEIKAYFKFDSPNNKYLDILNMPNTCSLHVRRGDYIKLQSYHTVLDADYYYRAINQFDSDTIFLVMSNDIPWCEYVFNGEKFRSYKFIFLDNKQPHEDLFCAIHSKNNIIANSSFSWWGAWLNDNPNKIVVSPKPESWFGPLYANKNTKDLPDSSWILL